MTCPGAIGRDYKAREQVWGTWTHGASDASLRDGGTADASNQSVTTIAVSGSRFGCRMRRAPHWNESVS